MPQQQSRQRGSRISQRPGGPPAHEQVHEQVKELLIHELNDLLSAEKQLVGALPKVAEGVADERLRAAIERHHQETEEHARRLEQVFRELGQEPGDEKCEAMAGLIREGNEILRQTGDEPAVKDAAIVGACQKVEHYEIAGYGTAAALARLLGVAAAVQLLEQTLEEEEQIDEKLTQIAEQVVNPRARHTAGSESSR